MTELYRIPVGDIVSDPEELARRLNEKEALLSEPLRRRWRVDYPLGRFYQAQINPWQPRYQSQLANPYMHELRGR